ncbi:MAG: MoaD/ThiS family protein [Pseudomonadota bacterium]
MEIRYFSWLRERVGAGSEQIETSATTARDLLRELTAKSEAHAAAFADLSAIRVAIDQEMGDLDTDISAAKEVAFFPPVTGG